MTYDHYLPLWKQHVATVAGLPSMPRRMSNKLSWTTILAAIILTFWLSRELVFNDSSDSEKVGVGSSHHDLACRHLPGANETVVILKTGATELQDKLPVHLTTTFRCYPHTLIFSDYEEEYRGHHIFDALDSVDPDVRARHSDFALWRRLQQGGRDFLLNSDLSGSASNSLRGTGDFKNPGWKLDKWKFLPMVNRTLFEYPDKKWYVFVETDTYVLWHSLLAYTSELDSSRQYYLGAQNWIGDIVFAHGGTGFIVSRPALEQVVAHFAAHQKDWEHFTDGHWAGDCVLGKAFKDSGTELTFAWPIMQGDSIGEMYYNRKGEKVRMWCDPTVSYHHLSPSVIEDLWKFEQRWSDDNANSTTFLRHKDVFNLFITPQIISSPSKVDWDNQSSDDQGPADSMEICRRICEAKDICVQFSVTREGRCRTSPQPVLGEASSNGVESGWIPQRWRAFYDNAEPCGTQDWSTER